MINIQAEFMLARLAIEVTNSPIPGKSEIITEYLAVQYSGTEEEVTLGDILAYAQRHYDLANRECAADGGEYPMRWVAVSAELLQPQDVNVCIFPEKMSAKGIATARPMTKMAMPL